MISAWIASLAQRRLERSRRFMNGASESARSVTVNPSG